MGEVKRSGKFSRDKGQRAERDACKLLQPLVNEAYLRAGKEPPEMARNLMQTRNGGHDIVGVDWLALEIKHHETLSISQWWLQTKQQATDGKEPVLMYKQNNVKWRVLMFGYVPAGAERVRCPVDISLEAFLAWFRTRLKHELAPVVIRPKSVPQPLAVGQRVPA